jgi:hypothetical protein
LIGGEVEAEAVGGDDLDVEEREVDTGGQGDTFQALTDDMQSVLGSVKQDATGESWGEATQAWSP